MKVCSLYGAGFYYMPGTDMCIKIGGWVRFEATSGGNGNLAWGPYNSNTNSRATNNLAYRARGYITADAREQTAYGVARAYIDVGVNANETIDSSGAVFSSNRAFVQWAGFTAGLSRSFYDFYNAAVQNYRAGYLANEDTGDGGWFVWAYTAQLGGGLSATLSAEARRTTQIVDQTGGGTALASGTVGSGSANGASTLTGALTGNGYGGWQMPDIVANIRADQAWGSIQAMAALHQVNPYYYGTTEPTGHPNDSYGWAAGIGAHINTPFITPGDYIEGEFDYTQGALNYIDNSDRSNFDNVQGGTQSYGVQSDCVFGGTTAGAFATGCNLTSAWRGIVSYEHYWTPQWHESFTGVYMNVNYNSAANAMLCSAEGAGNGTGVGSGAVAAAGCNNNWSYWGAGSRLQWDVTKSFYIGVEALYLQQTTASSSTGLVAPLVGLGAPTLCSGGTCTDKNESNWVFTLRVHKDFLP